MKKFIALFALIAGAAACGSEEPGPAGGSDGGRDAGAGDGAANQDASGVDAAMADAAGQDAAGQDAAGQDASGQDAARPDAGTDSFQPLAIGASWTYHVVDPIAQVDGMQTDTITAIDDVGGLKAGTSAYHYHKAKVRGGTSDSWFDRTADAVVIYRDVNTNPMGMVTDEEDYSPDRVRIDETAAHTMLNATWTERIQKTNIDPVNGTVLSTERVNWTVVAVDEMVTVPAGMFSCIQVSRDSGTGGPKTYWFSRGVGKVKEMGQQTEELVSYTIP